MKITIVTVAALALGICAPTDVRADVFTQSYVVDAWNTEVPNSYFSDITVNLGFGVATVDSIWVEFAGVSHTGRTYLYDGLTMMLLACYDLLFVSFIGEPSQGDCGDDDGPRDGVPDCIGSSYATTTLLSAPFVATRYMSAIERGPSCRGEYVVLDPRPGLADLFSDGTATLRFREIDCGMVNWPCEDGLADIATVTVNVAYDPALPVEKMSWGGLKACYR